MVVGCGDDPPFPEDFERELFEARTPCTLSHDHDLRYIRVFANGGAFESYTRYGEQIPYETDALLLKVEYYDEACTEIRGYTTMRKLPVGSDPAHLDWEWQKFGADRVPRNDPRTVPSTCITCHSFHCAEPPYGWDYSCPTNVEPPGDAGVDGGADSGS